MADHASDYHRGEMEIGEQVATYSLFMGLTKWGSLAIAAMLLLLTVWFCTSGGFMGGFVSALVLTVIGVLALRSKPEAH
jgi:hypothetical protein